MRHGAEFWTEVGSTVLMTLTTVATAWCAFQSAVWSGIQTFDLAESAQHNREALQAHVESTQQRLLDADRFDEWLDAEMAGDERLARFHARAFAPELRRAFEAWLALDPLDDPEAPADPQALDVYVLDLERQSRAKHEAAVRSRKEAAAANHQSDLYVLATVLLTMVLLFAGLAPKLHTQKVRLALLSFAAVVFVAVILFVTGQEVSFGT